MNTAPPINILDSLTVADRDRDLPLHVQVRRAMRQVIEEHFEDGQQFWTEQVLIERLNVSQITVRRALNDLAKDGFLLRRAAKGTVVRKNVLDHTTNFRVSIFVPKHNSDILNNVLEHVATLCRERKQRFQVYYTYKGQAVRDALASIEHPPRDERVILFGQPSIFAHEMLEVLAERGYRAIAVDTTIATEQTDYVGFDDSLGVKLALDHLMSLGHRRITLLVNEPDAADDIIVRRRAFEQLAAEAGIEWRVVSCGTDFFDNSHDAAYLAMPQVWAHDAKPTAVLTVSDAGAWAALKWFNENGVRVPEDVSVMGFDDDRLSRYTHPALTTLGCDRALMTWHALEVLSHPTSQHSKLLLPPHVVIRKSTGPISGSLLSTMADADQHGG
ncbi:MAG TPA: substrate-binding domain-containing protein [Capsulimonadaceae bacterium]|jgi:LacI family transcriptional regulator